MNLSNKLHLINWSTWNPDVMYLTRKRSDAVDLTGTTHGCIIIHCIDKTDPKTGNTYMWCWCCNCNTESSILRHNVVGRDNKHCQNCSGLNRRKQTDHNRNYLRD